RVDEQDAVEALDRAVGLDEIRAFGDADQRADVVEQVDEKENKDDLEQTQCHGRREYAGDVEFQGGVGQRGDVVGLRRHVDLPQGPAKTGDGEDADEHRALHFPKVQ